VVRMATYWEKVKVAVVMETKEGSWTALMEIFIFLRLRSLPWSCMGGYDPATLVFLSNHDTIH
jgi:hypothetical protein